jgi:hypothetical protein
MERGRAEANGETWQKYVREKGKAAKLLLITFVFIICVERNDSCFRTFPFILNSARALQLKVLSSEIDQAESRLIG